MSHSHEFLQSPADFADFVQAWETGLLPKVRWTHAAHVAISAHYNLCHGQEEGLARMRSGIIRYNEAVGTANTEASGYHETLTCFWMATIAEFLKTRDHSSRLDAVRDAVETFGEDRERHKRYYSLDVVRDRRARKEWVAPDNESARPGRDLLN